MLPFEGGSCTVPWDLFSILHPAGQALGPCAHLLPRGFTEMSIKGVRYVFVPVCTPGFAFCSLLLHAAADSEHRRQVPRAAHLNRSNGSCM